MRVERRSSYESTYADIVSMVSPNVMAQNRLEYHIGISNTSNCMSTAVVVKEEHMRTLSAMPPNYISNAVLVP